MPDKRINIFNILRQENKLQKILLYNAQSVLTDPYERTTEKNFIQPIAIDALVRDVSVEALKWAYYGNIPIGSKEIIIEKRHINTIKAADRIKIGEEYFKCYKDDQKGFGILSRQDYLVVILEKKVINT
jgi:hypothetical protein